MSKKENVISSYKNLPRSIYILAITTMINKCGNFVLPFLTIFLTKDLNFTPERAGIMIMIGAFFYVPGSLIGGKLTDKYGRKSIYTICSSIAIACFIPCIIDPYKITSAYAIFGYIFFISMGEPALNALITDLTVKENRNSVYSLIYMGSNIGNAMGTFIAGILYNNFLRFVFLGEAVTTFISIIIINICVKETFHKDEIHKSLNIPDEEKSDDSSFLLALLKRKNLIVFAFISMIYSFVYAQHSFVIPQQLTDTFSDNGTTIFGYIMSLNAVVVVVFTAICVQITRKFKSTINIIIGGLFYLVGFGMLYFINSFYLLVFSTIIWSIGEIIIYTNQPVYIANRTPISHRGRFNSVMPIITGAGRAFGPALMGMFITMTSIKASWILTSILMVIAMTLMFLLYKYEKKSN